MLLGITGIRPTFRWKWKYSSSPSRPRPGGGGRRVFDAAKEGERVREQDRSIVDWGGFCVGSTSEAIAGTPSGRIGEGGKRHIPPLVHLPERDFMGLSPDQIRGLGFA